MDRGEVNAYCKCFGNIVKINQENKQKLLILMNYQHSYEQNLSTFL